MKNEELQSKFWMDEVIGMVKCVKCGKEIKIPEWETCSFCNKEIYTIECTTCHEYQAYCPRCNLTVRIPEDPFIEFVTCPKCGNRIHIGCVF